MGTNFYHHKKPPCPTCGHADDEPRHIGKSSSGWCFSLHVYPEEGINTLSDWIAKWAVGTIRNEYDETVTPEDMLLIVTARHGRDWENRTWDDAFYSSERGFHVVNHSMRGPNGLARHAGGNCIGHGEGTWDYITGNFS